MVLDDPSIKAAKSREKPYKLYDEKGLYLLVDRSGGRWWRFKYMYKGREKLLSLGTYPDVSLDGARAAREEARAKVRKGIDPSAERQAAKLAQADTFKAIAAEWLANQAGAIESDTLERTQNRLAYVWRTVGGKPLGELTARDLLIPLKAIEKRGRIDTAHRTRAELSRVMRYAVATGRAERDPIPDLAEALKPLKVKHFAAITEPLKVGQLLRAIDAYDGQPATEHALKLAPLVFVRPGELRGARWAEFDLEGKTPEWRIPASRMKMDREHIVPLSRQAVAILESLHPYTGESDLLFPSIRDRARPISDTTLNVALRRMGYSGDEMTAHGFRSMASTLLNEMGIAPDVIELQLAHVEKNKSRAAYNRAARMSERRTMMQKWADRLDKLKAQGVKK